VSGAHRDGDDRDRDQERSLRRRRMVQEHRAQYGDAKRAAELLNRIEQPRGGAGLLRLHPMQRLGEERRGEEPDAGAGDSQRGDQPQSRADQTDQQQAETDVHQARAESLDQPLPGTPSSDPGGRRPRQQDQARPQHAVLQRELLVQYDDQGEAGHHGEEQCRRHEGGAESTAPEQAQLDQPAAGSALLKDAPAEYGEPDREQEPVPRLQDRKHQQSAPRDQQRCSGHVERGALRRPRLRQQVGEREHGQPERHIHEEHHSPRSSLRDHATEQRP